MTQLLSTLSTSVETAKTEKKTWTLKNVLWACALSLALILPWKASAQGQISPETKKDSIECVVPAQTQKQDSSTISYDEATWLKNEGKRIFTKDEILEIIKNNQEILNDTSINELISEKLYESLLENEEMQQIIQEMKNSDDIKKAFIEWNYAIIQDTIKWKLDEKFDRSNHFLELMWSMFIALIIFFLLVSMCMPLSEETEKK